MKHLAVLTLVAISFSAIQAQIVSEYFPVSLGNIWEYEREDSPLTGYRYTIIEGEPLFPGVITHTKALELFNTQTGVVVPVDQVYSYIELTCPNYVCESLNGTVCYPILPITLIDGDSINTSLEFGVGASMKVEFIGDYTVPAGTFENCYLIKSYANGNVTYPRAVLMFAPGVGVIRQSTGGGTVIPPQNFIVLRATPTIAPEPPQNEPSLSLEHFHFIPNNPKFDSPLGIGHSDEVEYFSVCADGSFASSFTVTVDADMEGNPLIPIEDIGVRINNSTFETTEFLGQSFINANNPGDPSFEIVYKHPEMIPEAAENYHTLQLEIYSLSNDCKIYKTFLIRVYRAPVLLVHGLFGHKLSMKSLKTYLDFEDIIPESFIFLADYRNTNDKPFEVNKKEVPAELTKLLNDLRESKISAGKASVIAHSMGGNFSTIVYAKFRVSR